MSIRNTQQHSHYMVVNTLAEVKERKEELKKALNQISVSARLQTVPQWNKEAGKLSKTNILFK